VVERAEREGRLTPLVEEVLKDNPGASRLREQLHVWQRSHERAAAAISSLSPSTGLAHVAGVPLTRIVAARWRLLAMLGTRLSVGGGLVWGRRGPAPDAEAATHSVVAPAQSFAETKGEWNAPPSAPTRVLPHVQPGTGSKLAPGEAQETFVHVSAGEFEPGTPDRRSALAACTEVEGDSNACERWLAREVNGVRRAVAAFDIDRTEVTTEAFAAWLTRGIERGRFAVEGDAVVLAEKALWRVTAGFSGLTLTKGASVDRATFAREYARLPITGVTHLGAREYCESRAARLPTALEWEFAARGSSGRSFVWE